MGGYYPALSVQPPPNLGDQLAKAVQLRSLIGEQQLQQIQIQNAQADQKAYQAANQQWQPNAQGQLDHNDFIDLMRKNGATPQTVLKLQQTQLQMDEQAALARKNDADAAATNFKILGEKHDRMAGDLDNLKAENTPADQYESKKQAVLQGWVHDQLMTSQEASQYLNTPQSEIEGLQKHLMGASGFAKKQETEATAYKNQQEGKKAAMQVQFSQNTKPGDMDATINSMAGGANTAAAIRSRNEINFLLNKGDYEGAKSALVRLGGEMATMERETDPRVLAAKTQVIVAGAQARQEVKDANTWYRWTDPQGKIQTTKGRQIPEGTPADPIGTDKDYATHLREGNAANIVQQSLNRVAKDVDEHPELWDNATARNIMTTTLEQIDRTSAGLLVAGTGGSIPLPSGMGDMINTALQNKALDSKTAAALKNYIADYKAMKDKGIVQQMEMQGGRIGRGSQQAFQAIVDQIPNGKTADSTTARRQIANLQDTQNSLMKQYKDEGKEQPYKMKTQDQAGGGHSFTYNGQRYQGVPDAIYQKYKGRPGFSEQ